MTRDLEWLDPPRVCFFKFPILQYSLNHIHFCFVQKRVRVIFDRSEICIWYVHAKLFLPFCIRLMTSRPPRLNTRLQVHFSTIFSIYSAFLFLSSFRLICIHYPQDDPLLCFLLTYATALALIFHKMYSVVQTNVINGCGN